MKSGSTFSWHEGGTVEFTGLNPSTTYYARVYVPARLYNGVNYSKSDYGYGSATTIATPCILYANYDYSRYAGDSHNYNRSWLLESGVPVSYSNGTTLNQYDNYANGVFTAYLMRTSYASLGITNLKISTTSSEGPWFTPDIDYGTLTNIKPGDGYTYATLDIPYDVTESCELVTPTPTPSPSPNSATICPLYINYNYSRYSGDLHNYNQTYTLENGVPTGFGEYSSYENGIFKVNLLSTAYTSATCSDIRISTTSNNGPWFTPNVDYNSRESVYGVRIII